MSLAFDQRPPLGGAPAFAAEVALVSAPAAIHQQPAPPAGASALKLDRIHKTFQVDGRPIEVLIDINLDVRAGEFVCLVGASGCGKSTILRMIGGLETPTTGAVLIDGKAVTGPGLDRGIVFQEHRLFPWLTVEENILLGLDALSLAPAEKRRLVTEHIVLVGLTGFEKAYPGQLSGGMAQRAAIARGLVAKPAILLLDEPLGALDALTRTYLQEELLRIWDQETSTTLMVTHDVEEALYLADRVIVLDRRPGRIRSIVEVDIERPRRRGDPIFGSLKEQVLGELRH
ncbi:ABC transporter ATP-binding protein [uncultured Thiodictyon sp.]|uniref:ABC transporter ATP-binding protein n=1 Tax=uncultured Thiodictyon sp. TaxID=1846217 RepID=UPI0025DE260D|nr:ABC transporter ATP-binding protein [uncultured Thiodictyon sp.]